MVGQYIIPHERKNNLQDGHDTHSFNMCILNPLELICLCTRGGGRPFYSQNFG